MGRGESGADDATVGYEYPSLWLYGVEIADPGPPVTLQALEEGLAGFTCVIQDD